MQMQPLCCPKNTPTVILCQSTDHSGPLTSCHSPPPPILLCPCPCPLYYSLLEFLKSEFSNSPRSLKSRHHRGFLLGVLMYQDGGMAGLSRGNSEEGKGDFTEKYSAQRKGNSPPLA